MKKRITELVQYRELLYNLVINELKLRYRNSILGFLWTVLNPLFFLLILAMVFSKIIKFQIDNYIIFLFAGLVSWMMIQQTVVIATSSIVNNQTMIRRVYVPKIVFPLSSVLARYIDNIILTFILFGFMAFFKMHFSWSLLFIPVLITMHFFFSLGLSLISAVANIKARDVQHIVSIIFQAFFYLTPIIYSLDILPEKYRSFFLLNPFYYFIQSFRYPVYHASLPPLQIFVVAAFLTLVTAVLGFYIFYKKEKYFVFHLT